VELGFVIAGAAVGFIIGLTGVGGGSLMTPLLVLVFGFPPAIAVGTDLMYAALTKTAGVWVHHGHKTIHWNIVGLLAIGSLPSALLTIAVLDMWQPPQEAYERIITSSLGVMLILTALVLIFKGRWQLLADEGLLSVKLRHYHRTWLKPITVMAGVALGVLVTLSSVGAGAIGTAILLLLYPRLPSISVIGTDLAHAVPLTLVAGLGHWHLGSVDFALLAGLLIGSLPAIYVGSHIGVKLPERYVRIALACMLMGLGLKFTL
jgi:hypothetical protein